MLRAYLTGTKVFGHNTCICPNTINRGNNNRMSRVMPNISDGNIEGYV